MAWFHFSPLPTHPIDADFDCSARGIPALFAVAGDFDGDGRDEIAVAPKRPGTEGNDFWVVKYDPGLGTWRHLSPIPNHPFNADLDCSAAGVSALFAVAGDFDGDGRDEIAIAANRPGTEGNDFWVMKFTDVWRHLSPIPGHPFDADLDCSAGDVAALLAVAGDFDKDGRDELAVAPAIGVPDRSEANDFWVMKFDARTRTWKHLSHMPGHPFDADLDCSATGTGVLSAAAGDFDGDGRKELAITMFLPGTQGNDLWVYQFDPRTGSWNHLALINGHPLDADIDCSPANVSALLLVPGDFDNDRRDELVISPYQPGTQGNDFWAMKLDRNPAAFRHLSPIAGHGFDADFDCSPANISAAYFARAGDFDGDGRPEIIIGAEDRTGRAGPDFWAMKFTDVWRHLSPIAGHGFGADLTCTPMDVGIKIVVVGDFDGDQASEVAFCPDLPQSAGNDFWVMKFDRAPAVPVTFSGRGRLYTTNSNAPGPYSSPITLNLLFSPNGSSADVVSMSQITITFAAEGATNTSAITLRQSETGRLTRNRATGAVDVRIALNVANTHVIAGTSKMVIDLSTGGVDATRGLAGVPLDPATGTLTLVGSGPITGGYLGGETAILSVSGAFVPLPP